MAGQIHQTQRIQVKIEDGSWDWADIDVGIIPVVQWLNNYPNVRTEYCCEDTSHGPYVIFYCNSLEDLRKISVQIHQFVWKHGDVFCEYAYCKEQDVSIEVDYFYGGPRFEIRWKNPEQLKRFIQYLNLYSW